MVSKKIKRRDFLKRGGMTFLGASAAVKFSTIPHMVMGANEKIVVGVIGAGSRGRTNMRNFMVNKEIEIDAVCDVYNPDLKQAVEMTGSKATAYGDFRKIIERKDIDVIINSTPDHWHALTTILPCDAGKDVYVEKPISHNIYEGRKMVEFARRNNCIVQVGTQQRSGIHFQRAVKFIRSGKLGEISMVKCWNFRNSYPEGIGNPPDSDPPPDLDWDMWVGPAPMSPYNKNKTRRYFWDFSGGMLTNWGTHLIDIVHWAMNVNAPLAVSTCGGKFYIQDNRETPDTTEVNFEYPNFICTYTHTDLSSHAFVQQATHGIQFYGTNGTLFLDRNGYRVEPETRRIGGELIKMMGRVESEGSEQSRAHVRNFIDCVKSRKLPICDIEIGHRSTSATHLGNISYLTKQRIEWDAKDERITNCEEANKLLKREYRSPWKLPE